MKKSLPFELQLKPVQVDLSAIHNVGSCETIWNLVLTTQLGTSKSQNVAFRPKPKMFFSVCLGTLKSQVCTQHV